ncbi:MAG: DUF721 domain-containing protein [Pseudomonadota bacterium]
MQMIPEKTIETILRQQDPQSILGFIQKKVLELKKINQLWQTEISSDLGEHSRVANFRDCCLVIEIDNAAWATRLRYLIPDLIKKLPKHPALQSLKHIEWYIQPHFHPSVAKKHLPPVLTEASTQLLQTAAENIKVKSLQTALVKLSGITI